MLLSSNARSIKLWRLQDRKTKKYESAKRLAAKGKGICFPKSKVVSDGFDAKQIFTFKSGKEQHLHSVSLAPDGENFISCDENRLNLWNLHGDNRKTIQNLVDYDRKAAGPDDERMTFAKFHNTSPVLVYSTNTGKINVCDLRERSSFHNKPSLSFEVQTGKGLGNIFGKWINCVSSATFVGDRQLVSRDYTSVKLWDLRATSLSKPIYTA